MIETAIVILVSIMVGYLLGYLNATKKDFREFIDESGQTIRIETKKLYQPAMPTGKIKPKSAEDVFKQNLNPERREALEETKKTLDNIPDLVAAKELFLAAKEGEYGR